MMYVKFRRKRVAGKGFGVFATEFIPKGKLVWKLSNFKKFSKSEYDRLPPEIKKDVYPDGKWYVLSTEKGESWNHSCDANTWWTADDELSARRDIPIGEEITYDYATTDIDPDITYNWECKCLSKNCRHKLNWDDILKPEIYKKYKGYLPSWVEKFVKENKTYNKTRLLKIIDLIHFDCCKLVKQALGNCLPVAGNIGIFCQSEEEYEKFTRIQKELTEPTDNPNQKYFQLIESIVIPEKNDIPETTYTHLYIRKLDPTPYGKYRGDVDFVMEEGEYRKLKSLLLSGKIKGAEIYDRPGWDNIQLTDPNIASVAYVSTKEFAEKVRNKF